ncbi:MAG TPA: 5-formyltetrahydrofolate cyclo-ligase [Sphingomonas sp.]
MRQRRAAFVAGLGATRRAEGLAAIETRLRPLLGREGPFSGYLAQGDEADVLPFLLGAFHLGHAVALPHVTTMDEPMRFVRWSPDAVLTPGALAIPQIEGGEVTEPAVVLAPLVGFDRRGRRLGQGGGYYDRWFAAHPGAMRIGVAWSVQEVEALAAEPWDMPLHAIVTEKEWIEP